MADIEIDVEAVEAARSALLSVRDTVSRQATQHSQTAASMESLLSSAAYAVFDELNPLHTLNQFGVWERWGFGGIAQSCSSTQNTIDFTRGTALEIVNQLCDAHQGQLAPILLERASGIQSWLGNALNSLSSITSLLNPANILWLMRSPWSILEHFSTGQSALNQAESAAQSYLDYLGGVAAREAALIQEIMLSLAPVEIGIAVEGVMAASSALAGLEQAIDTPASTSSGTMNPPAGIPVPTPVPSRASDTSAAASVPSLGVTYGTASGSSIGNKVGATAQEVAAWLQTGDEGKPNYGIDLTKFPASERALVTSVFARASSDWQDSDGTPKVECVAFVALVYALASGNKDFLPVAHYADQFWQDYGPDSTQAKNWQEITNQRGSVGWPPEIGDIVAMSGGTAGDGHVAIVTNVLKGKDGNVVAIDIAQANAPDQTKTLQIQGDGVFPALYSKEQIQGFIRYRGP